MVRESHPPEPEDDERQVFPDGTEHVVVAEGEIQGNPPEGYSGSESGGASEIPRLTYEVGDALPADIARSCFVSFPDRVIVLNENGDVLATPTEMTPERVSFVIDEWNDGGFDPSEYETASD